MAKQLSIIELKELISFLSESRGFDISGFTNYQLKINIKKLMIQNRIASLKDLLEKLKDGDDIFSSLLDILYDDKIALYREPSMWRFFRDEVYPKINTSKIYVWFPDFIIEDLYTLAHIIDFEKLESRFSITASHFNSAKIAQAKTALLSNTDIVQAISNYKRYDPLTQNKLDVNGTIIKIAPEFIKNKIHYIKSDLQNFSTFGKFDLVFYRNRLIYYKVAAANKNLQLIANHMKGSASLFLGTGENLSAYNSDDLFAINNKEESVYKRKFNI